MQDELIIHSGLDQFLESGLRGEQALRRIEELVYQAIEERDLERALNICKGLIQIQKLSGIGLARVLYILKENWHKFGVEESFEDTAYVYIGIHRSTQYRYVAIMEMFKEGKVPAEIIPKLEDRGIGDLIPIAFAIKQGYEITEQHWKELLEAPDTYTVSKIVREKVKQASPRSSLLEITMDSDGTLYAHKENDIVFIGALDVLSSEEIAKQAIARIIDRAHITLK